MAAENQERYKRVTILLTPKEFDTLTSIGKSSLHGTSKVIRFALAGWLSNRLGKDDAKKLADVFSPGIEEKE